MIYSPHTLYVRRLTETRDEFNRASATEEWEYVGVCRCDDNSDTVVSVENSKEYVPRYHVVTPRTTLVKNGDYVKMFDADGSVRGEGTADRVRVLNYLDYADFYAG